MESLAKVLESDDPSAVHLVFAKGDHLVQFLYVAFDHHGVLHLYAVLIFFP